MALICVLTGRRLWRVGRGGLGCWVACAFLLLLPHSALAAPPNDNFADAVELSGLPAEATGSNVDATRESGEPNHLGQSGEHSIWFKWTAPTDGGVTLNNFGCAPPFQDSVSGSPVMAVYAKTDVFGLAQVASLGQSFRAMAGQVYWIAADTPPNTPTDPDICVRLLPGPANDDFARATPLTGFPVSATQTTQSNQTTPSNEGGATSEPGEPNHGGQKAGSSVWYSWTAPDDRPVVLRSCGLAGMLLAVYTGDRVEALTNVATRRLRERGCGNQSGASIVLSAIKGEVYRIAVASENSGTPPSFQLLVGSQVAVVTGEGQAFFSYTAFPGQTDDVELRLAGAGRKRAFLLDARGVTAALGCHAEVTPGLLRCPVPGRAPLVLDIDLGDRSDTADIRLLGPVAPSTDEGPPPGRVLGGRGNDALTGSAGSYTWRYGWSGGLRLVGGPGADRLRGGSGFDRLQGGPGPDSLAGGPGDDAILGGDGPDQIAPGAGRDSISSGPGDDRIRTADGSSDNIRCQAGRDRARLDGIDLPQGCERRKLDGPARAVATQAFVTNGDGEDADHLEIFIACPIDARRGCRSRVTPAVPGERTISRRLKLVAGRSGVVKFYRLRMNGLIRRGVRVTVSTQRRGRGTLKFTQRLPVIDDRYEGE